MPRHAPEASIVIVAYGKRAVTETCLTSLEKALGPKLAAAYEVVLVDNASPDDTLELFRAWEQRAVVVALPENRNFSGGCNAGAAAAAGRVLVFLNNDTEVAAGALEALVAEAQDPSVGAVGIRLLYPDGSLQHGGFGFRPAADGTPMPFHLFHGEAGDLPAARARYDLEAVTAACVAMRRDLFLEAGGFDEGYANGWEDIDLCLRLRQRGLRIVYRGDVAIVHHEGVTGGKKHGASGNEELFRRRWQRVLVGEPVRIAERLGARFDPGADGRPAPDPSASGSRVSVEGLVRSCAPEGDEARALLAAFQALGMPAAAREWFPCWISPVLDSALEAVVSAALERVKNPKGMVVQVPSGGDARASGMPTVLRLAAVPRLRALRLPFAAWAACPEVGRGLVEAGFPPGAVHLLEPPIFGLGAGLRAPGDAAAEAKAGAKTGSPNDPHIHQLLTEAETVAQCGIFAILPAHDLPLAEATARALASCRDGAAIRLVWTLPTPQLAALARAWLPGAAIETGPASEGRTARHAARADVVVHVDHSDGYQRLALAAAGAGAALVARGGGPAQWVLGAAMAVPEAPTAAAIARAVMCAREQAPERSARAQTVARRCGPEAMAARLRELTEAAWKTRTVRRFVPVAADHPAAGPASAAGPAGAAGPGSTAGPLHATGLSHAEAPPCSAGPLHAAGPLSATGPLYAAGPPHAGEPPRAAELPHAAGTPCVTGPASAPGPSHSAGPSHAGEPPRAAELPLAAGPPHVTVPARTMRAESVLMWYPELPDPDRSSGHRRAFEILLALARMGCRPTLLTHEAAGAGAVVARLEDCGVEVCASDRPGLDARALLHRGFSTAIVSFFDLAERALPLLRAAAPATRIVVDSVDVHFRRLERAARLAGDAQALAKIPALRARELRVYALADLVLAVSEEEQELLCAQLPAVPVAVVPNVHHVPAAVPPCAGRRGAIFVGGFGHPPNADAVRFLCEAVLPRLRALGYRDSIAVAGSRMPAELAAFARAHGAEVLGFLPRVEDELARRRMSLAPLRYGAGLKGKVGESLAEGVPVVGTSVAAEGYQDPGRGMLVADDAEALAAAVVALAGDDALWSRLSEGGRALIRGQLGPDRCERELGEVLEHLSCETAAMAG